MKLTQSARAACFLVSCAASVSAISFDITGRTRARTPALSKRASTSDSFGNGSASLYDMSDTSYTCNITLGGEQFEVQIDTGSVDLWVIGNVPGTHNTTVPFSESYGKGSATGFINTAELVFDNFVIENQAYVLVDKVDQMPNTPGTGLIGFGPSSESVEGGIAKLIGTPAGDPPLDRIFRQNMSTPNILTILLSRASEQSLENNNTYISLLEEQPGQLTVGEVIPEYESVTKQPKLPALVDNVNQHWMTLLDPNGIVWQDGTKINTTSTHVETAIGQSDQLRVVFDSGFTLPQMPAAITDAIYGRIPGANFSSEYGVWLVPCDYELNISFFFENVEFPIHPLDLTLFEATEGEENICAGSFQPIAANIANDPTFGSFDAILGMAFLRNAYLLINFGDFVDGSNSSVANPYMQLLPTINTTLAHQDFVNVRLGGKDTTGSQAPLLPVGQGQTSSSASSASDLSGDLSQSDSSTSSQRFYQTTWFIIVISVIGAFVLACIAWSVYVRVRRTRRSNVRSESAFVPPMGSYKPLIMKDEDRSSIPRYNDHETGAGNGYHDPYYSDRA